MFLIWQVAIIDDDFQVLEAMKKMIPWEKLNASLVGVALDGEEGLQLIHRAAPDIVITDIYMPVMDGMHMLELLKEEQFSGKIVILSGYSDFDIARNAIRLDVHDYLIKPVTLLEITESLERAIAELQQSMAIIVEHDTIREQLLNYEQYKKQLEMKQMLWEHIELSKIEENQFFENHYHIVAVNLEHCERLRDTSISDWNLYRFAVQNIMLETAKYFKLTIHVHELIGPYWIIFIDVDNQEEEQAQTISDKIQAFHEAIINHIRLYLKLSIVVGYGGKVHSRVQLTNAIQVSIQEVIRQNNVSSAGKKSTAFVSYSIFQFYQFVTKSFIENNEDEVKQYIQQFIEQLNTMSCTAAQLQQIAFDFLDFLQAAYEQNIRYAGQLNIDVWREQVQHTEEINHLSDWFHVIITYYFEQRYIEVNIKHKQVIDFIIQYIHDHYGDDIQLETLAGELYLTRNYINQLFKKAMGETFNIYLTKVRMERAKAMIMEGKYLIYEISEHVGYKNTPYFSKLFKRYTGMNPSDFMKK